MDDSIKDFFDKVMRKYQKPESNNDDNQGSESADDDNQEPEWNQDYFENDRCPYCGCPDYYSRKLGKIPVATIRLYDCADCPEGWAVMYNANGEIKDYKSIDEFLSLND